MKNILMITLLCLAFFASDIKAQCVFNTATGETEGLDGGPCANPLITALPFLRINPDARSAGLGDAGLTLSADPSSMYFNASKLAFAEDDLGLSVSYTPWLRSLGLNDVYMAYLSGYKRINDLSTVGVSLKYFRLGSIQFKGPNSEDLGEGNPNEFELAGAYTRKLSEKLSVGLTAKFIFSNLAAGQAINNVEITPATAGAADISLTYITPIDLQNGDSELTIAAAATNIGTKVSYTESVNKDFLPANLGVGVGYKIDLDQYNQLTFLTDFNKLLVPTPCVGGETICETSGDPDVIDYKEQGVIGSIFNSFGDAPDGFGEEIREITYSLGVEYWYDQQFAIRAGYFGEATTKGNRKYFTLGLGLKYNIFGLNFSYLIPTNAQRSPLDNTLRFGLNFDFGAMQNGGDLQAKSML
jgi:hypothetical protein